MTEALEPPQPSVYEVDYVAGYEGITFLDEGNIPTISENEAKEAFVQYVARKRCYNKAPAREMVITDLQALNTYRYRLETFTESRFASWKSEPYWDEEVDSPQNGAAPLPWDLRADVPDMFKDKIMMIKVPHTSSITGCPVCECSGRKTCTLCWGHKTVSICLHKPMKHLI
nr:protein SSUH2 homolog [Anolis sagrei ordinatus]